MAAKKNESRSPINQEGRDRKVRTTDNSICPAKEKKFGTIVGTKTIAGTKVRVVEFLGKFYIPEIDVGKSLDQERNNFRHLLERNSEILEDYPLEVMVTSGVAPRPVRLLTLENVRASILLVDHNVKDPDRKQFLIQRKREYIKIVNAYYSGNQVDARLSKEWQEKRKKVATNWNRLCDELKITVVPTIQDPSHERFVYINEAKNLNKNVYGKHKKGIRDHSTLKQIEALENAEAWAAAFAHMNVIDGKARAGMVKEMLTYHYPDLEFETTLAEPIPTIRISAPVGQKVLIEFIGA